MSIRHIPISILNEWHFCHCTAKFWGKKLPRKSPSTQTLAKIRELSKLNKIDGPIVTDELIIIPNNFELKSTLIVDNGLFLMGSVDNIILNKKKKTCYIFNIKKAKKIPNKVYKSDKNLAIIYNLLLFRFIHREKRNYQIRIGFEFLEKFKHLINDLTTYKIGEAGIGYFSDKWSFMEELIFEPEDFFEKSRKNIFFIRFNLENIISALDQLLEMISESSQPYYIERNHKNLKKCKNCYYNILSMCENSLC